jgi:hypothetical protein
MEIARPLPRWQSIQDIGHARDANTPIPDSPRRPAPLCDNMPAPAPALPQCQPGEAREQGHQDGGGAGNGLGRPLPLDLHPEMGAALFPGHLDRPAPDHPRPELHRRGLQVSTAEDLHPPLARGVAEQPLADVDGRPARGLPQGGARADPQRVALTAVPVHRPRLPGFLG